MIIQTNVMTFKIMKPFIYSTIWYEFYFTYKESEQMSKYCNAKRKLGHIFINTLSAACSVSLKLAYSSSKQLFKLHSRKQSYTKHSQDKKKTMKLSITLLAMWVAYYWQTIHCNQQMINCKFVAKLTKRKKREREKLWATVIERKKN